MQQLCFFIRNGFTLHVSGDNAAIWYNKTITYNSTTIELLYY